VHILGTVEVWRAASTDSIVAENRDAAFLDQFVTDEVVVVVRCEIRNSLAVDKLDTGASGTRNDRAALFLENFKLGRRRNKRFGGPIFN
jgi:hypothetical protein